MIRAKSSDPSVYRQVMYEGVFDGITGAVEFDSKGDPKNPAFTLYTYMNNLRTLEGVYRLKSF
jgi:branched-chain amino acid transport system substrate-binding protein